MIQKSAIGILISLTVGVIIMKIIVAENLIVEVVDINQDNIYREMTLMKQDTKNYQSNLGC